MHRFALSLFGALVIAFAACATEEPKAIRKKADVDQKNDSNPLDSDGDGYSDADEIVAGTDPNNPGDIPPAPSVTIDTGPEAYTSTRTGSVSFTVDAVFEVTTTCALDGAAFAACSSPWTVDASGEGPHIAIVRITDKYDRTAEAEWSWVLDTVPPVISWTAAPPAVTNEAGVEFTWTVNEEATVECSLNGAAFTACASPFQFTVTAQTEHTLSARAVDLAGNFSSVTETTWQLDMEPPAINWITRPPEATKNTELQFAWTIDEAALVECSLNEAAFAPCESPYFVTLTTETEHGLTVRATDAAGNLSQIGTSWEIDLTPPDTVITGPQWAVTSDTSVTVTLSTPDGEPATFECSFDQNTWWACENETTVKDLLPKTNRLYARAIDAAGNIDATPAEVSWRNTSPQAMFRAAFPVTAATAMGSHYPFEVEPLGDGFVILGRYGAAVYLDPADPEPTFEAPAINSAYLARYDADGSLLWARRIVGAFADAISVSTSGQILVGGTNSGAMVIGDETGTPQTLPVVGGTDAFIALYDQDGMLQWVNSWGSMANDTIGGVAFGSGGAVFAGGTFMDAITFATGTPDETTFVPQGVASGRRDAFIARFTDTGNFVWAQNITAINGVSFAALAAGGDNEVVAGGDIVNGGDIIIRPGYGDAVTLSGGVRYSWLVRLKSDGSMNWVRQLRPSANYSLMGALKVSADGAVAATGNFYNQMTLGSGEPNQTTLNSSGITDAYVAVYESDGTLRWAEKIGSSQTDEGLGVQFSRDGESVFVTGWISPGAVFDPGGPLQTSLTNVGGRDAFLAGYGAADGSLRFATNFGVETDNDRSYGIAHLTNGRLVVVGHAGAATPMKFGVGEPHEGEIVSAANQGYVSFFGTP